MLPLSGPDATVGIRALRGILVAARVFERNGAGYGPVTVTVRDTKGTPEGAARAVSELVEDEGAVVLVGPLSSGEAPAAAAAAQRLRVPIITLTQREDIIAQGEYVFRSLLTPTDEARAVAIYATRRLLISRFAILHPEDPFGRALATAFAEEIAGRGGRITKRASYEGVFDIPEKVGALYERVLDGETAAPWDAIFIPDGVFAARIAVRHLREAGVNGRKLLGTGLWNTSDALAGDTLAGAVFGAAFSESDTRAPSRAFSASYRRTFDDEPDALAAQAHDAAALLVSLMQSGSQIGPQHLRERLEVTSGIEGAAGTLRFKGRRDARRGAIILTVRGGQIVPLVSGKARSTRRPAR